MGFQHIVDAEMNHNEQCLYLVIDKIINCGVKKADTRAVDDNHLPSLVDVASERAAWPHMWCFSERKTFCGSNHVAERNKESERARNRASKKQVRYTHCYSALSFSQCINAIFTCIVHISYVHCGCVFVANFQTILCQYVDTKNWWQVTRICLLEM